MNDQPAPLSIFNLIVPLAVLFFAMVAFIRGRSADRVSRRLAGVSLCCGLLVFAPFELVFGLTAHGYPTAFRVAGLIRIAVGAVGIVWGIRSLQRRRLDHGTGVARPVIVALLSAVEVVAGGFFLMLTGATFAPKAIDPETAWVYRQPEHEIEISLPSKSWRKSLGPGGLTFFAHQMPSIARRHLPGGTGGDRSRIPGPCDSIRRPHVGGSKLQGQHADGRWDKRSRPSLRLYDLRRTVGRWRPSVCRQWPDVV